MNRRRLRLLALLAGVVLAAIGAVVARTEGRDAALPAATDDGGGLAATTVKVFDDGVPCESRWVVFHQPDGRVVSSAKSDKAGAASAVVAEGGLITVAYGESIQHLVTVAGVKPGDSILVGEAEDEGDGKSGRTVASALLTLPGPRAGAARYSITLGGAETEVGSPDAPLTLSVIERYVARERGDAAGGPARFRALGEAFGLTGEPMAYSFAWGDAESARADAGERGGLVAMKLPPWSTAYRSMDVVLAGAPDGLRTVRGNLDVVTPRDNRFVRPPRSAIIATETALHFAVPEPLGDDVVLRLEVGWDGPDKAVIARRRRIDAAWRIDLAAELLPRVSKARAEHAPDPARPIVHWSVADAGAKADATVVRIRWPATGEHVWTIVLPPSGRAPFRLPELPDVLADWRPDARALEVAVALLESSVYASYDEVRAKGIDVAADGVDDDDAGALRWSATGNISF